MQADQNQKNFESVQTNTSIVMVFLKEIATNLYFICICIRWKACEHVFHHMSYMCFVAKSFSSILIFRILLMCFMSLLVDKDIDRSTRDLTIAINDVVSSSLSVNLTIAASLMLLYTIWVLMNTGKNVSIQQRLMFIRS